MLDDFVSAIGEKEDDYKANQFIFTLAMYGIVQSKRYLHRGPYWLQAVYMTSWSQILNGVRYNDDEFLKNFCTSDAASRRLCI